MQITFIIHKIKGSEVNTELENWELTSLCKVQMFQTEVN